MTQSFAVMLRAVPPWMMPTWKVVQLGSNRPSGSAAARVSAMRSLCHCTSRAAATTFIQRVNTAGGIVPTTGCKSARDTGKKAMVPYTADYVFYRQ